MTPLANVLQSLRFAKCEPKRNANRWQSKCPAHDDSDWSLGLSEENDGSVLLECRVGCSISAILELLRLRSSDLSPNDPNQKWKVESARTNEVPSKRESREIELLPASRVTPQITRWLWRDRLPLGGACLLAGQEGLGKTTIAVDIAARASRGQLDGDLSDKPCSVVYATAEDSWARTLRPRFEAADADLERVHFVVIDGLEGGLEVPGDLATLEEAMRKVGARLLVLDPLTAHLHGSLDTHRDASVRKALAPLAAIMDRLDASALGIMHWSKAPTTVVLDRVNGSRGFTAAARAVLAVAEDPDDQSRRVLVLAKSNLGRLDVPAFRYAVESRIITAPDGEEIETSGIVWLGETLDVTSRDLFSTPAGDAERSERIEIAGVLRETLAAGPKPRIEVVCAVKAAGFSVSDKTIQRVCHSLGVKSKPGGFGGSWVLTLPSLDSAASVNTTQKRVPTGRTGADTDGTSPDLDLRPAQQRDETEFGQPDSVSIATSRLSSDQHRCVSCGAPVVRASGSIENGWTTICKPCSKVRK